MCAGSLLIKIPEAIALLSEEDKNRTALGKGEITARIASIFFCTGALICNVGALAFTGTPYHEIAGKVASVAHKVSRIALAFESGARLAVHHENGTAGFNDDVRVVESVGDMFLSFIPRDFYTHIAGAVIGDEEASLWFAAGLKFFVELVPHVFEVIAPLQRMQTMITSQIFGSSGPSFSEGSSFVVRSTLSPDVKKKFLERLWADLQNHARIRDFASCDFECSIEKGFTREELKRFFCPLSRKIIICPLRHTESGMLFEKAIIEQKLEQAPHFVFVEGGNAYDITRNALVSSSEDQVQIAKRIEERVKGLRRKWSSQQSLGRERSDTLTPQPSVIRTVLKADEVAQEQLHRQRNLTFFIAFKERVWTEIKHIFDRINGNLRSKSYWPIDPRQHLIELAKPELAKAEARHKLQFAQPITLQELREKLKIAREEIVSGFISWILFDPFIPITTFEPLTNVKIMLHDGIPRCIELLTAESLKMEEIA